MKKALEQPGFHPLDKKDDLSLQAGNCNYVIRNGLVDVPRTGKNRATNQSRGARLAHNTHTCLNKKPNPYRAKGFCDVVESYGVPCESVFDRDLSLPGITMVRQRASASALIDLRHSWRHTAPANSSWIATNTQPHGKPANRLPRA